MTKHILHRVLACCLSLLLTALFTQCGSSHSASSISTAPQFGVSPLSVSFGNQLVGTAGQAQSLYISNSGTANLVITGISVSGANAADFSMANPPTFPLTVVANTNVKLQVVFKPGAAGTRNASLAINDNASSSPHLVALVGTGTIPVMSASPSLVQFGTQPVGVKSTPMSVNITNSGDGSLIIYNISASGDFTYGGNTSLTVSPRTSALLSLTYLPSKSGVAKGTLTIADNAAGAPHMLDLVGTGVDRGPTQADDASVTFRPNTIDPAGSSFPTTITVAINGTDTTFAAGATVANFGPGTVVGDGTSTGVPGGFGPVNVTSPTSATAQVTFENTVSPGSRFGVVMTGGHQSAATFIVPSRPVPFANAGVSQKVELGRTVRLDGSGSSLPSSTSAAVRQTTATSGNSNPFLAYDWALVYAPSASTTTLTDATTIWPSFIADQPGNYLLRLAVTDQNGATTADWVLVSTNASVPVAGGGADQFVIPGATVQLNGSDSSDPDGDSLTYAWSWLSKPDGSTASLSDATAVAPKFVADLPGDYLLQLTVNDGHGNTATDEVLVIVDSTTHVPPIANAGEHQKVQIGGTVNLDGSASRDPDGEAITCSWTLIAKPTGSTAALNNSGSPDCSNHPSFVVDLAGIYVAQLEVTDTRNASATATVTFSTDDPGPVAVAGPYQEVATGATVQLDGSQSHDSDSSLSLKYKWSFVSKPLGSTAALSQTDVANPTFVADVAGDYVAQLVVSTELGGNLVLSSVPGTVRVNAASAGFSAAPTSLSFATQTVATTSDSASIVITNTGARPLLISAVNITGGNASDFAYTSAALPVSVEPNATTMINVTFTPSDTGSRDAVLSITNNVTASPATIPLYGTGARPTSSILPSSLIFGPIVTVPPTTSEPQTVTIQNTGNGNLIVSEISVTGDFVVTPASGFTVTPGSSRSLSVTFTPTAGGTRTGVLSITDNASAAPEKVALSGTGITPGFEASPQSLDFGSQLVATTSAAKLVTLENTGTADLHLTGISITGPNAADFATSTVATQSKPITIAPNATTQVSVTYSPAATGNSSAHLTIVSTVGTYAIPLAGLGIAPAISITPNPVAFGNTRIRTSSTPLPVTISNAEGTAELKITGMSISGTNSGDFRFDSTFNLPTPNAPLTVPAGSSSTVGLVFTPSTAAAETANLVVTDNATGSPHSIVLNGTGTEPRLSVSLTTVTFPAQLLNTNSNPTQLTITNTGTANLVINELPLTGAEFFLANAPALPLSIVPAGNVVINVVFKPLALGARSATLTVADQSGSPSQNITLAGTGVGTPVISTAPTNFGTVLVNTSGTPVAVTITNTGNDDLTISGMSITGTNATDFTVTSAPAVPFTVAPGGQRAVSITFKPSALGSRAAVLQIANNSSDNPHEVTLTGTGIGPGVGLSTSNMNFAGQLVTTTSPEQTVSVTNSGDGDLVITDLAIGSTNAGDFSFPEGFVRPTVSTPIVVPPSTSTTLTLYFTPTAAGGPSRTASLIITDNGKPSTQTVALSGTAVVPTLLPSALSFPDQLVRTSSNAVALTINNPASHGTLVVSSWSISPNTEFTVTNSPPQSFSVWPGQTQTFNVVFAPAGVGSRTATFSLTDNTGTHTVTLSGNGVAPIVSFQPSTLNFGNQTLNITSSPTPVTITNAGTAALTITDIRIVGTSDFAYTSEQLPITVPVNSTTTVNVTFRPSTSGTQETASLVLTDNTIAKTTSLALTGTGVVPGITVSPTAVAFGSQLVNTPSNAMPITITNNGQGRLFISNLGFAGLNAADFSFPSNFTPPTANNPITVEAASSTSLTVIFTPTAESQQSATLHITSNANPATVPLSGTGIAAHISISINPTTFGNVPVGTQSAPATLTIANNGTADLKVTDLRLSGNNVTDFVVTPAPALPLTVPTGASTNISVVFQPSIPVGGAESATLTTVDNAITSTRTVTLSGTGTVPVMSLPPSPLDFSSVNIGSNSTVQVLVTNSGLAPMKITGISISGGSDYSLASGFVVPSPNSPITVAANNGTTAIPVTFAPTAAGSRVGALSIADNATGSPHQLGLTGIGVTVPNWSAPSTISFPDAIVGNTVTQTLTVSNTGMAGLQISSFAKSGANSTDFTFSGVTFPQTVPVNGSVTFTINFAPITVGNESSNFIFYDNTPAGSHTVSMSGTGLKPTPNVTYTPPVFSNQLVGTTGSGTISANNTGMSDLMITQVSMSGDNSSEFVVTTALPLTIPKGQSKGIAVSFTPTSDGSRTATLTISGTNGFDGSPVPAQTVPLTASGFYRGTLTLNSATIGGNLQTSAIASLDIASTSNLDVTFTSSDPAKLLLRPGAGTSAGGANFTVTVPANSGTLARGGFPAGGFWIQALASSGTPTVTLTAPGYRPAVATVTLTPSGFVLNGPKGTGKDFTALLGSTPSLTVSTAQLDMAGNPVVDTSGDIVTQPLRGGITATVPVNSATVGVGTISGSPAIIQPGTSASAPLSFQTVAGGTTRISVTQPSGFATPTAGAQMTATVIPGAISLSPLTVGYNQQVGNVAQLNLAPTTPLAVTVTSSDPTQAVVSADPTLPGSTTAIVTVPVGGTTARFYVQGLVSSGSVTLTVSAPEYSSGTGTVVLVPSTFVLTGPNGTQDFSTTPLSGPSPLKLTFQQLNGVEGQLRPGASASVTVVSSTPSTGTVLNSPAVFQAGDSINTTLAFQPQQNCTLPCTTVLSVTEPPGYSTPSAGGQLTVTVTQPKIMARVNQATIGANLQVLGTGAVDAAPASNLAVSITSSNPNVLLSTDPTLAGSTSITVTLQAGNGTNGIGFPLYYVQALSNAGTAQLTISAPGYQSSSTTVTLAPSGFVIVGPNGVGVPFGTQLSNGTITVRVDAVVLDSNTLSPTGMAEAVRGGLTVAVPASSDSAVVVVATGSNPVTVAAGAMSGTLTLQLQSTGQANVSIATPPGFTAPLAGNSVTVMVN